MLVFWLLRGYFAVVASLFGTAAGIAEDIPIVGDTIGGPFRDIQGFLLRVSEGFSDLQAWADSLPSTVWSWIQTQAPWLSDPVGHLWEGIWGRIQEEKTWLQDPVSSLFEGIRDRFVSNYTWIADPVESLWDEIQSHFEAGNPWILDPVEYIWGQIRDRIPEIGDITGTIREVAWDSFISRFDDWFFAWAEWQADAVVNLAGRVLDIVLGDEMTDERWIRWRSRKD
jgi:hypothetical protein